MRYVALACDYDGTLAHDGRVDDETIVALECLRETGRKLLLVTGRELDELTTVFPRLDLFDRVVAENGALLYRPATREELPLAEAPPPQLVERLRARHVRPLAVGRVVVATLSPHETTVLDVIRELGLELHVIFNKGSVMVLPSGTNKATGLATALDELALSPRNTVGIGDAENDHAFLALCECAVAVANALPTLKERADVVTAGARGAGVVELIQQMIADDLAAVTPRLARHRILLGTRMDGEPFTIEPYGGSVLVSGTSGGGKSTLASGMLERLGEHGYQFCIVDPEGDYEGFAGAVVLGGRDRVPAVDEALEVLARPKPNVVVNLVGVPFEDRPAAFDALLPRLAELRARTGRPHWIVLDEAHHLVPAARGAAATAAAAQPFDRMLLITLHPQHLARPVLDAVETIIAVGEGPGTTITDFAAARGLAAPAFPETTDDPGVAVAWRAGEPAAIAFRVAPPQAEHRRHRRKYAEGALAPDESFYFRGPEGKLNLRAQNLTTFLQLADGVDPDTWLHHLRNGEYSAWFRKAIKDDELADEAAQLERTNGLTADESRARIRAAIEERYTLPA